MGVTVVTIEPLQVNRSQTLLENCDFLKFSEELGAQLLEVQLILFKLFNDALHVGL